MSYVSITGDVSLNYRIAGEGPVMVFHPGFSNTANLFNWLVADLSATHRCVTFDPRGHGGSDKPDSSYTLDELATDLSELLVALDLRDVTLVGHSLGGAVAVLTALDHDPERRVQDLALTAPAVPALVRPEDAELGMPPEDFDALLLEMKRAFVPTILATAQAFFHNTDEDTARWIMTQSLDMPVHLATRLFAQLAKLDLRDRLRAVTVPASVIWGAQDQMSSARWLDWFEQHHPSWNRVLIEDAGHGLMVDQPTALATCLRTVRTGHLNPI